MCIQGSVHPVKKWKEHHKWQGCRHSLSPTHSLFQRGNKGQLECWQYPHDKAREKVVLGRATLTSCFCCLTQSSGFCFVELSARLVSNSGCRSRKFHLDAPFSQAGAGHKIPDAHRTVASVVAARRLHVPSLRVWILVSSSSYQERCPIK